MKSLLRVTCIMRSHFFLIHPPVSVCLCSNVCRKAFDTEHCFFVKVFVINALLLYARIACGAVRQLVQHRSDTSVRKGREQRGKSVRSLHALCAVGKLQRHEHCSARLRLTA